jgi:hypothetical protein
MAGSSLRPSTSGGIVLTRQQRDVLLEKIDYGVMGSDIDAASTLDDLLKLLDRYEAELAIVRQLRHSYGHYEIDVPAASMARVVWTCVEYVDDGGGDPDEQRVLTGILQGLAR